MSASEGLANLLAFADRSRARAPEVSNWSVGMHVEHCCLAMNGVCGALANSVPPPPRAGFSLLRFAMLKTGFIPRGRGKAPAAATPKGEPDPAELLAMLERAEADLSAARELSSDAWFRHFVFGVMKRDESLRFLAIHNAHHVKIMRDIVARDTRPGES